MAGTVSGALAASTGAPEPPGGRLVIASIAGFWLFYATAMTVRSLLVNPWRMQLDLLGTRLVVDAAGVALTLVLWAGLRSLDRRSLGLRVVAAAIGCGLVGAVFAVVNTAIYMGGWSCSALAAGADPARPIIAEPICNEHWRQLTAEHLVSGYFLLATWAALYLALGYAAQVRGWERRGAALRAAAQTAELKALRYQVNPHFLFNTLNALSSLVLAGRAGAAEAMIGDLATYYRASLTFDPERDITLADEMEMQRLYLAIEAVRFPDRLAAVFDLPGEAADARVPGMLLQPLVENAVKHGVARSRGQVTVRVAARVAGDARLVLEVDDDAVPLATARAPVGTGLGLRNVADRLAARHGDAASIRWDRTAGGGFRVRLDLPLVRDAG